MAPATPRPGFNSSKLTRFLADLAVAHVADGKQSFAEKLGLWLDWTDAISLSTALNAPGSRPEALSSPPPTPEVLAAAVAQVRHELAESIRGDGALGPGKSRISLPGPTAGESAASAADFAPYRHYHLAHQRAMDAAIAPLRGRVRVAIGGRSPALGRLAAVDAVLDEALRERERKLFSSVPLLMEKHFQRLYKEHRAALGDKPDEPAHWMQPGAWLARYCRDMQGALMAELDTRLQSVEGLLEALAKR